MMDEHKTDYHLNLDSFNPDDYLNAGRNELYTQAMDKLNSMGKLNYVFYDLFKPIGGNQQKYIRVVAHSNGEIEISGVVGLEDCEHVEWEYGSMDYLRSLNTGNQKYELRLDVDFNEGSALYWKPDQPEEFTPPEDPDYDPALYEQNDEEMAAEKHYRYFKKYEKERYLRWFGTDHVPAIDVDSIKRMTICSIPMLDNDTYSQNFTDADANVQAMDLAKTNIDESTSQSLLTLAKKSAIEVYDRYEDGKYAGQYIRFVVSGHQQTSNISFRIVGKLRHEVQDMNHFDNTWGFFNQVRRGVAMEIMFLNAIALLNPTILEMWNEVNPDEKWIPDEWREVEDNMSNMVQSPTCIDLLRMRQIDIESIALFIDAYWHMRIKFLEDHGLYNENLYNYIFKFNESTADEQKEMFNGIQLPNETKMNVLTNPLRHLYWLDLSESEQEKRKVYETSFDDVKVDELRESI